MKTLKKYFEWIEEDPGTFIVIHVLGILLFFGFLMLCSAAYNDFIR